MRTAAWAAAALAAVAGCRSAPEAPPLTVGEVVQMSKADLGPGTIIARIRAARLESTDLTPSRLITLHREGLDPQVLSALVLAAAGEEVPPYEPDVDAPPEEEKP